MKKHFLRYQFAFILSFSDNFYLNIAFMFLFCCGLKFKFLKKTFFWVCTYLRFYAPSPITEMSMKKKFFFFLRGPCTVPYLSTFKDTTKYQKKNNQFYIHCLFSSLRSQYVKISNKGLISFQKRLFRVIKKKLSIKRLLFELIQFNSNSI